MKKLLLLPALMQPVAVFALQDNSTSGDESIISLLLSPLACIALLSVIALFLGIWNFRRHSQHRQAHKYREPTPTILAALPEAQQLWDKLSRKADNTVIQDLLQRLNELERKFSEQTAEPQRIFEWFAERPTRPQPQDLEFTEPDNEQTTRLFAKYADLPNGFSATVLSEKQNGEQVYELDVKGNQGFFRIATDPAAQRYAISDVAYTLRACDYAGQPDKESMIRTKNPGTIKKEGNSWIIQYKATIEFIS